MPRAAAKVETTEDDNTNADIDNVSEVDDFRTGQVSEAEQTVAESVARRMGWVPRDEWKREPTRWVDAAQYLERTPTDLEELRDRLRRSAQASQAALDEERRRAKREALEDLRAAERAGDTERANSAAQRVEAAEDPPPQVQAWIGNNPWFTEDPDAADHARRVTNRLAREGLSVAEQLEGARKEVMKRFPEHFGGAERRQEPAEARLSEVRPRPPVQAGSRGPASAPKERGWGDLPPATRTAAAPFVKAYRSRGLSEADAQAKYAGSYWRDQA